MFQLITMCALDIIMETSMGQKIDALHDPDCEYAKAIFDFRYFFRPKSINFYLC